MRHRRAAVRRGALAFASVLFAADVESQQTQSCPAPTPPVYRVCQVDVAPAIVRNAPVFVAMPNQKANGYEISVLVQFVVDTNGVVPLSQTRTLRADFPGVDTMLMENIAKRLYQPALRDSRKVATLMQELFYVVVPPNDVYFFSENPNARPKPAAGHTVVGTPARDSTAAISDIDSGELFSIARSLLALHQSRIEVGARKPNNRRTVCLNGTSETGTILFDSVGLRSLSSENVVVVTPSNCPRTYASMFRHPNDPKMPEGYVDPFYMTIQKFRVWSRDQVYFELSLRQGTSGESSSCGARKIAGAWIAYCGVASFWVN